MTTSLPVAFDPIPCSDMTDALNASSTSRLQDGLARARVAAAKVANRVGAGVLPVFPDATKRLMTRAVTIDGNTLDPTLQMALTTLRLSGEPHLTARDDVEYSRERIRLTGQTLNREPVPVGLVTDLSIPGGAGNIAARHYRPPHGGIGPLLMYIHGGGFVVGDLDVFDHVCRSICRNAGIHVLSVSYRLAPEHPAPAAADDCYAAYRWALDHGDELGTRPGVVAVGGDSAGGNLAAVISRLGRDEGVPPALQLLLYPWTDMRGGTRSRALFASGFFLSAHDLDWCREQYLGGSQLDITDPLVSPLLAEDLSGLPPALVVTAGFDVLRDEGEAYAARLRDAGVTVDLRRMSSLIHSFPNFSPLGGGSAVAMAEVTSALRAHLCYA